MGVVDSLLTTTSSGAVGGARGEGGVVMIAQPDLREPRCGPLPNARFRIRRSSLRSPKYLLLQDVYQKHGQDGWHGIQILTYWNRGKDGRVLLAGAGVTGRL
jgi:hypothetical protein